MTCFSTFFCLPLGALKGLLATEVKTSAHWAEIGSRTWKGALVVQRQQLEWSWPSFFTWSKWDFLIESGEGRKKEEINEESRITKVKEIFAYRKEKNGCSCYTPTPTQTHKFTPNITVLKPFFLKSNCSSFLFFPPSSANEAVYSTPYWHGTKFLLFCQVRPPFFSIFALLPYTLDCSIMVPLSIWECEVFNYWLLESEGNTLQGEGNDTSGGGDGRRRLLWAVTAWLIWVIHTGSTSQTAEHLSLKPP